MKREEALSFFTSRSGLSFTAGNVEREAPAMAMAARNERRGTQSEWMDLLFKLSKLLVCCLMVG